MPREAGIARKPLRAHLDWRRGAVVGVDEVEPGGEPVEQTHRRGHPPP